MPHCVISRGDYFFSFVEVESTLSLSFLSAFRGIFCFFISIIMSGVHTVGNILSPSKCRYGIHGCLLLGSKQFFDGFGLCCMLCFLFFSHFVKLHVSDAVDLISMQE